MTNKPVKVSYRNKENGQTVDLGTIDLDLPETVAEAIEMFGEEDLVTLASHAYIINKQREHRDANRPDRPKEQTMLAKFKTLSKEKQEELLAVIGA